MLICLIVKAGVAPFSLGLPDVNCRGLAPINVLLSEAGIEVGMFAVARTIMSFCCNGGAAAFARHSGRYFNVCNIFYVMAPQDLTRLFVYSKVN